MSQAAYAHVGSEALQKFGYEDLAAKVFADGGAVAQHAQFTSDDAGRSNDIYGAVMWNQANVNTPWYGLLPKVDATGANVGDLDDPRPQTFRAAHSPPQMDTPAEGGSWGSGVTYETKEASADPNHSQMKFEGTIIQQIESQLQDDVPFDQITVLGEDYWQLRFETQGIARAVAGSNSASPTPVYSQDTSIAPIDRVIASSDEEANATDINGNAFTDGDLDIYGIDRSATGASGDNEGGWADAEVDHNAGNGDRQLTADLVDGMIERLGDRGAKIEDLVIYTGRDSARVLNELRESKVRFQGGAEVGRESVNGEETRAGMQSNSRFRDWDGIPIVEGQNCPADSLSRIYFMDLSTMKHPEFDAEVPKIGVENYFGPIVETAGPQQETNTLATNTLAEQAGYLQTHEVVCRRFGHMGKVRDLAE